MVKFFYAASEPLPLIYKLDARVKVVAIFIFVCLTSTLTAPVLLFAAALFILGLTLFSRLPALFLARRLLWIIPFGGVLVLIFPFIIPGTPVFSLKAGSFALVASEEGVRRAAMLFLRVMTAVTALTALTATTRFRKLMDAFRNLRVPAVMVQLIEFTFRYMYVLSDELQRMRTARRARGFDGGKSLFDRHAFLTIGSIVGTLFVRSLDRAERVYNAMLARGYGWETAEFPAFKPPTRDLCWGAAIVAFALALRFI